MFLLLAPAAVVDSANVPLKCGRHPPPTGVQAHPIIAGAPGKGSCP